MMDLEIAVFDDTCNNKIFDELKSKAQEQGTFHGELPAITTRYKETFELLLVMKVSVQIINSMSYLVIFGLVPHKYLFQTTHFIVGFLYPSQPI